MEMLGKYFKKVETIELHNSFRFVDVDDIFECFQRRNELHAKFFSVNEKKIKKYFADKIEKDGEIIITTNAHFQHCYNWSPLLFDQKAWERSQAFCYFRCMENGILLFVYKNTPM